MNNESDNALGEVLKIGARVLHEEQAKVILPNYDKLHSQVNDFREQATQHQVYKYKEKNNSANSKEFNSNFNNVISILGQRGTGKSSVMMTFKYYHTIKFEKHDLILPVIDPDQISNASHALGWIISFLQIEMKNIDYLYKKTLATEGNWNQERFCDKEGKSALEKSYFELQKAYLLRQESYADIIKKRDEGVIEYIRDNEKIINYDRQLIDFLHNFIDVLIETKKEINNSNKEPLILIFFDDVDISAGRCVEVLDTIRIFFSHPNIVTFVSGDYNVFLEAITIHMLHEERIDKIHYKTNFINDVDMDALSYRRQRSKEYLKKVFSPTFRFEMKSQLSNIEKKNFKYFISNETNKRALTLNDLICNIELNFVEENESNDINKFKIMSLNYFNIFDNNPRGLINVYYFLYQRNKNGWGIEDVNQFLNVIIDSSSELESLRLIINKLIDIKDININPNLIRIDYSILPLKLDSKEEKKYDKRQLTLFLLASFFEELIHSFCSELKIENKLKIRVLTEILNKLALPNFTLPIVFSPINLFPRFDNIENLLDLYQKLSPMLEDLYRPIFSSEFSNDNDNYYLERKYLELISDNNHEKLYLLFKDLYGKDEKWIENIITYITKVGQTEDDLIKKTNQEISQLITVWDTNSSYPIYVYPKLIVSNNLKELESKIFKELQNSNDDMDTDILYKIRDGIELIRDFEKKQKSYSEIMELELEQKSLLNKKDKLELERSNLNDTRWIKSSEKLKEIRKRIKNLNVYINKIEQSREIPRLISNYLIEQEIEIDRYDVDKFLEKDKNALVPFIEALDEDEIIAHFYPLEILEPYLDKYLIKQIVKNENLEFVGLLSIDEEELSDISEVQINEIKEYFNSIKEISILRLLLPKGETTLKEDLNLCQKNIHSIEIELISLAEKKEELNKSIENLEDKCRKFSVLLFGETFLEQINFTNSHLLNIENIQDEIMKNLVLFYTEYENKLFLASFKSTYDLDNNLTQKEFLKSNYKFNLENLYFIIKEIISGRKNVLSNFYSQQDIWKKIITQAEIIDNLIITSQLYSDLRFTLESIKIVEDERIDGEIFFFTQIKKFLKKKSKENFGAFDLYLKRLLDNE